MMSASRSRNTISLPLKLNTTGSLGGRSLIDRAHRVTSKGRAMASWGPVQQRLPSLLAEPIAFAHRGARAHARENTLEAFQLALKLGATGLESDVWVTSDGVAVLDHDGLATVRRRKRPIRDLLRSQLL